MVNPNDQKVLLDLNSIIIGISQAYFSKWCEVADLRRTEENIQHIQNAVGAQAKRTKNELAEQRRPHGSSLNCAVDDIAKLEAQECSKYVKDAVKLYGTLLKSLITATENVMMERLNETHGLAHLASACAQHGSRYLMGAQVNLCRGSIYAGKAAFEKLREFADLSASAKEDSAEKIKALADSVGKHLEMCKKCPFSAGYKERMKQIDSYFLALPPLTDFGIYKDLRIDPKNKKPR